MIHLHSSGVKATLHKLLTPNELKFQYVSRKPASKGSSRKSNEIDEYLEYLLLQNDFNGIQKP